MSDPDDGKVMARDVPDEKANVKKATRSEASLPSSGLLRRIGFSARQADAQLHDDSPHMVASTRWLPFQ